MKPDGWTTTDVTKSKAAGMPLSKGSIAAMFAVLLVAGGFAFWRPAVPPAQSPRASRRPRSRGRRTGRDRRLRGLPHRLGRAAVCRRPRRADAVRHCVCHQYYARPGNRHRPVVRAAFRRAMRDGIDRAGRHLYPVLPYPHFTRASDQDIAATVCLPDDPRAGAGQRPANRLPFPLDNASCLPDGTCCI